ncbi:MAG: hypothetical protein AABX24_01960 [Nanoarchaeota archaeon]
MKSKKVKENWKHHFLTFFPKEKKGIMVQFLVSLLLCLMIFIPACYLVSGIFRTSEQAKDNFSEFVKGLNDFQEHGQIGERKSVLLIMDDETAIAYFEKGTQETVINVDAKALESLFDYSKRLLKPGQCDDTKNCLCLFRESESDVPAFGENVVVTPKKVLCTNLDYGLTVETCNVGKAIGVNSYTCEGNNFMIERALGNPADSYYEIPRRTVLYFIKFDDNIRLIGNYGGTNE